MRISDWSSDVCSSDLPIPPHPPATATRVPGGGIKANPDIYPPTIVIEETLPSSREVSSVYRRKMIASPTFPGNNHARKEVRRSEEHTSELQSLMRISYAVFCLTKKTFKQQINNYTKTICQLQQNAHHHKSIPYKTSEA